MLIRRYPRLLLGILCLGMFAFGYYRECRVEKKRVEVLMQSSRKVDQDFQALINAYQVRLNTVHALVTHAVKNNVIVPSSLVLVLNTIEEKSKVSNQDDLRDYQNRQATLGQGVRDLIAAIDSDLAPGNSDFVNLYRDFLGQEERLKQIQNHLGKETKLVESVVRKGDRKFLSSTLRLPSNVKERL